ncbi:MAG: 2-oxoacid:acceptor oxidoreductase subunit alpha [Chloroflexi bacterium]|nr:2-oxoacid:acceptor oxidoreductase subunit alpha [Chloroflexota bacterium]
MAHRDLVIRVAGESGEGVQSTGQLVAQAAARGGLYVLTYYTVPAEIKGGHSLFQIRLSNRQLTTHGDQVDILVAFNQEAHDRNIADLKSGGLLIYDSAELTPPDDSTRRQVPLPLTEIAKGLRFERGKNVVAVGAITTLFGLPTHYLRKLVEDRFKRYPETLPKNVEALEAGVRYVESHVPDRQEYLIPAGAPDPRIMLLSGNQALSLGALASGVSFFAGYPITPASDIMEFLAAELPKAGGAVIQVEDEIAAICAVLGASFAGKKAMTATSGPGFSLMIEGLGLGSMAELPVVVVDAQRAGPSTGMPTKHEQGDLYLAAFGGHGEIARIVIAPTSVEDCFYQVVTAFNLAEKYQTPVIFLTDIVLAMRIESMVRPDLTALRIEDRLLYRPNGDDQPHGEGSTGYHRYAPSTAGVSPMSIPGQPGGQYVATGLEHGDTGRPRYDPETHSRMTEKRFHKLRVARQDAPPAVRLGDPDAELGIITWGSTTGVVAEAMERVRSQGIAVDLIAPRMLRPLPDQHLEEFFATKRTILVPEVNYSGQFADLLTARYRRPVIRLNTYGGVPFRVERIVRAIEEVSAGVRQYVS